jgi:hypothetical protein
VNVFSSAGTNDLVDTVFNDEKFTSIENHADVRV